MRLTIVQYAGDFREASERLAGGGEETYGAQRYTVDHVEKLASHLASVTTITGFTDEPYDVVLPSGARAIGAGFRERFDCDDLIRLIESTAPDLLILRTPNRAIMRWAIRNNIRTLVLLADSFGQRSIKSRVTRFLLTRLLRAPIFDVVANHGIRAARQLVSAGVPARKVIAWDYPNIHTPADRTAKATASAECRILYVGMLIAEKGVDDLIEAARLLIGRGMDIKVDLIGKGDTGRLHDMICERGLENVVEIVGPVQHSEIIPRMAAADVVIVPSRHEYPEGVPLTIYEAYCARTPLIVSDHPMLLGNVEHEKSGLVFEAKNPSALAAQVERLFRDAPLYASLSEQGAAAWEKLQLPVKWGELIDRWLDNSEASRSWLSSHSLAAR
jgi:glycosyltransferase involved in cell wall biosynthesis